ncbi:ovomucoid [Phodopus roborovskii]|uniref:RGD1559536 protein n=1 Tax=Phodopus roborovskii TaxID=109678 RepID=A0AAU9ZYJ7_PHORO|nr:ovomucoid [Phodopus roborovskii]CAH7015926.1 RGD1559536 [Phodopus roborovskii]
MLFFSRVMYITLLFLLYSESAFIRSLFYRKRTLCSSYSPKGYCTREYYPVCGNNGKTYGNKCTFCVAHRNSGGSIKFSHYGKC